MSILKLNISQNVWITADTHYFHKNLCKATSNWDDKSRTRDFISIDSMNNAIINNINKYVGQNDILIHGGDLAFSGIENIFKFCDRLICKNIHIVTGNHDSHIKKNHDNVQSLFLSVSDRIELIIDKKLIIIDHYPLLTWEELSLGSIMLHGHTHLPNDKKFGKGRLMDIGLDGNSQFSPYNILEEIIPIMLKRGIKSEMDNDYHLDKNE